MVVSVLERLFSNLSIEDHGYKTPCWVWTGYIKIKPDGTDGYGRIYYDGRMWLTHRLSWTLLRGEIPPGLTIDHLCRYRSCFNPRHLEPVTHRVNVLRGIGTPAANAAKTHCPQNHPYDEQNTYRSKTGARICRTCNRDWQRTHRARQAL